MLKCLGGSFFFGPSRRLPYSKSSGSVIEAWGSWYGLPVVGLPSTGLRSLRTWDSLLFPLRIRSFWAFGFTSQFRLVDLSDCLDLRAGFSLLHLAQFQRHSPLIPLRIQIRTPVLRPPLPLPLLRLGPGCRRTHIHEQIGLRFTSPVRRRITNATAIHLKAIRRQSPAFFPSPLALVAISDRPTYTNTSFRGSRFSCGEWPQPTRRTPRVPPPFPLCMAILIRVFRV